MNKRSLLRMGARRLSTIGRERVYLATGFDATLPEAIECEVNERCNYACRYCHFWRMEDYAPEMSIEEWKRVLLQLQEWRRFDVKFIGGEPFLKKGFVELLEFCGANRIRWGVITNGSAFTRAVVERVVAADPAHVAISVDSPVSATHDAVRGAPRSLASIESGIRRLSEARRAADRAFPIRVIATVTRCNYRDLPKFDGWLAEHGADTVDFHPVHELPFWSEALRAELWPTPDEVAEMRDVLEELVEQKAAGAAIETPVERLRSFPDQFLGIRIATAIPGPCRAGMRRFSIQANGDVSVCWEFPSLGNVRFAHPRDVWYGEAAASTRRETVRCPMVGTTCANSCLDSRSLRQDVGRGLALLRAASERRERRPG